MILNVETQENCKKCFHFQVCSSVLKNDLFIREVMLKEKEPKCKSFVKVVRCKDCKWRQQDDINRNFCGLGDFYCGETDFCSRGERKDNAD